MASETAIRVNQVRKTFKLPHEKHNSIKSLLINLRKRKKGYERQRVLKDISFEVKKGEFFAIVGRNGSGKSTLLKMLAGIYAPDTGSIVVEGKLIPFIELGVGFNPDLSGRENIFLNGALLGFNRKEMEAMYGDIVKFAELERFMDQKLKNYSSGMQVRLAFSIAIRARGDILLLDEVLAVGDAAFQQKCFNYFEELKAQKKTVVFVSHDMSAVRRFCSKAIYLRDGDLILEGDPAEVADQYMVDNIENQEVNTNNSSSSGAHAVSIRLGQQTANEVEVVIAYNSKDKEENYVGISLIRDGVSIGETITSPNMPLVGDGQLSLTIDTTILNGGLYEISTVICRMRNREMLALGKNKIQFALKGSDDTKGGAIKIADTWKRL